MKNTTTWMLPTLSQVYAIHRLSSTLIYGRWMYAKSDFYLCDECRTSTKSDSLTWMPDIPKFEPRPHARNMTMSPDL